MDGFYLGNTTAKNELTLIDLKKHQNKGNNFLMGRPGTGRGLFFKRQGMIMEQENYIVDNHLNNNNWLKQHGKPMIRRGHNYYELTKELKKRKPFKIIVLDPEKEYETYNPLEIGKNNL